MALRTVENQQRFIGRPRAHQDDGLFFHNENEPTFVELKLYRHRRYAIHVHRTHLSIADAQQLVLAGGLLHNTVDAVVDCSTEDGMPPAGTFILLKTTVPK